MLGGLTVILAVVGWVLPHASAVQALGTVPMGVVAYRHRLRAVVAATVAATVVALLVAGSGPVYAVVTCAIVGGAVGDVRRRGRGLPTIVAVAAVVGPLCALGADALLWLFSSARALTLDQVRNIVHGVTGLAARLPYLGGPARSANRLAATALRDWWWTIPALVVAGLAAALLVAWDLLGPVLERLDRIAAVDRLAADEASGDIAPVPVALHDVRVRYPGADHDALGGVDLVLDRPEMVALVGSNGSGKSTLARVLAGRAPTGGRVQRAGVAGLGRVGGTALVAQRPESQILGVRVADDVVWGLGPDVEVDVDALLDAVGLAGMGGRETTTLSGGEMQRLAIAAALARRPRLLLSDESTAMIDHDGRRDLVELLAGLPSRHPMTVVHVTHRVEETRGAGRVVHLAGGRVVDTGTEAFFRPDEVTAAPAPAPGARTVLELRGVSHTYADGTPWAQPALHAVDLSVRDGEGLLIVGGNGSGKSTLAWVLAGLLRPSEGAATLDGHPVADQVGAVGLAFQHARLQLQRPTVGADIRAAAGVDAAGAEAALAAVGLGPELAGRPIDQLSGGQMRRVAIAGLLARRPRVLVLDEPLAGLDPPTRSALLAVLAGLRRQQGLTLVVISHDLEGMDAVCDRAVRLAGGHLQAGDRSEEVVGR